MNFGYNVLVFLYHFLWTLGGLFLLPFTPLLRKKRLFRRLLPDVPPESPLGGGIWIHALSVGEVISAVPLVNRLASESTHGEIVFTVSTAKGMAVARTKLNGNVRLLLTMPLDAWWAVRPMARFIRPSLFVLVETDIWPGLLDYLQRRNVKAVLVNGRVSPGTYRSYRKASFFVRRMLGSLDACLMQSDLDCERLFRIGVAPAKVRRVGNIKFDQEWHPMRPEERRARLAEISLAEAHVIWVAGSTHPGEETVIFRVFKKLLPAFPQLRLILAPRQVNRGSAIGREARQMGLDAVLRTETPRPGGDYHVLVLDTLGELGRFYGLGRICFVGGSLTPFGGHNLLEPAAFGCPVLFGPHTHNFVDMSESLIASGGGRRVRDGRELCEAVRLLLSDEALRSETGARARRFVRDNRGAVSRIVRYLESIADECS